MEGKDENTQDVILFSNLTTNATTDEDNVDIFRNFPGKYSRYTPLQAILIILTLGLIIVLTVMANFLVCVAVFIVKKLRRPWNYLLFSLAISDLCVALLVMPMALFYEIFRNWIFGATVCYLWVSFDVLSCTASILNLCMISLDRYWAITDPLQYGVKRTPKRMAFYVLLSWLIAACVSLSPQLIIENSCIYSNGGPTQCNVCQNVYYQIYATLVSFFIPLSVMIMVYRKIHKAARKMALEEKRAQSHLESHYLDIEPPVQHAMAPALNRQLNSDVQESRGSPPVQQHRSSSTSTTCSGHAVRCFAGGPRKSNESQCPMLQKLEKPILSSSTTTVARSLTASKATVIRNHLNSTCSMGNSPHQKKLKFHSAKDRKAITTLGIIMGAFTVCWLPFFVLAVIRAFLTVPNVIPDFLSSLFLWLGYCNSLLNPIIYVKFDRDFRKPFREIVCFRCSSLNRMMREEFYQSQYGDPVNNYEIKTGESESGDRLDDQTIEAIDVVSNARNESFL